MIRGTLKYFSRPGWYSNDLAEQDGYYLALDCYAGPELRIDITLLGGVSKEVHLFEDGLAVLRITDPKTQRIKIVTSDGYTAFEKITYYLSELELEPKPE